MYVGRVITPLKFSPDDRYLLVGLSNGEAKIFLDGGEEYALFQTLADGSGNIHGLSMSNDCRVLVTGSSKSQIRVYVYQNGKFTLHQTIDTAYRIHEVVLSQGQLAYCGKSSQITFFRHNGSSFEFDQVLETNESGITNLGYTEGFEKLVYGKDS